MTPEVTLPKSDEANPKFIFISFGILALIIVFSTYLHHFQPQVLQVPSTTDLSSWTMPPFEKTWVYERMNEEERAKVLQEGIPGTDFLTLLWYEAFSITGACLCFVHARKYYGTTMASCFLLGSFVFTGLQESIMILTGRFWTGGGQIDPTVWGSYFFPQHLLSFIEAPVWVCLCWFIIAYSCVWVAGKVFPNLKLLPRAVIGALIAVIIDLWQDPVLTSPEHLKWIWAKGDHIGILGIPHGNFSGWFFLIFIFAVLWEKYLPGFINKHGIAKGGFAFLGLIFCSNLFVFIFLIAWGATANTIFVNELHIPPQSWGW